MLQLNFILIIFITACSFTGSSESKDKDMSLMQDSCLNEENKLKVYLLLKELILKDGTKELKGESVFTTFQFNKVELVHSSSPSPYDNEEYPKYNIECISITDAEIGYLLWYGSKEGGNMVSVKTKIYSDLFENQRKYEDHFCQSLPKIMEKIEHGITKNKQH